MKTTSIGKLLQRVNKYRKNLQAQGIQGVELLDSKTNKPIDIIGKKSDTTYKVVVLKWKMDNKHFKVFISNAVNEKDNSEYVIITSGEHFDLVQCDCETDFNKMSNNFKF